MARSFVPPLVCQAGEAANAAASSFLVLFASQLFPKHWCWPGLGSGRKGRGNGMLAALRKVERVHVQAETATEQEPAGFVKAGLSDALCQHG